MRTWLTTGCVLVLVGVVSSARVLVPDDIAVGTSVNAGPVKNNDQSMVVSTVQNPHDYYSGGHGNKKHDEDTERRAYLAAKYTVPPHAASKFEDAWEDLQKQTYKEYDEVDYFVLRKPKWDNHVYYGYSEWHSHRHAQRHRESHLFEDFADFLDDHDIKWELFMLENLSEDIEDQQQEEHRSLLGLDKADVSQGSLLQVGRRHKKDKEQDEQDQQDDDWDKNIPDEYRPYIPEKYRPKHKDEEDDTTCRYKSCDCKHCHCDSKGSRCHCHKGRRAELGAAALATLPQDASEDQMLQAYANVQKKSPEDAVLVFIEYFVEPHLREKFVDVWTNAAEETIKEKGNYVYSLRRVLSDNTRLWIYGVWDSWGSYMDHFQSHHIQDLRDFAADKDIVWFAQPMEVVGDDKGRSQ